MVVKLMFEPDVEPYFHDNSYGYRQGGRRRRPSVSPVGDAGDTISWSIWISEPFSTAWITPC